MRALAIATTLLLSSTLPLMAQESGKPSAQSQPQTTPAQPQMVPVQPERTPQQSDEARREDRKRAEDTRINRDWRAQHPDDEGMDRMTGHDWDHRKMGRDWRMRRDDDEDRGYYDDERPRRRVKICFEYDNGDEYCRYRR
jgi:hypothetical protein